jgi:hypothetical protein
MDLSSNGVGRSVETTSPGPRRGMWRLIIHQSYNSSLPDLRLQSTSLITRVCVSRPSRVPMRCMRLLVAENDSASDNGSDSASIISYTGRLSSPLTPSSHPIHLPACATQPIDVFRRFYAIPFE